MNRVESRGWTVKGRRLASFDPLRADAIEPLSLYWQDPAEELSVAGLGIAAAHRVEWGGDVGACLRQLERLGAPDAALAELPFPFGPWFGGLAFDPTRAGEESWDAFGASSWIVPRVLVWNHRGVSGLMTIDLQGEGSSPVEASATIDALAERLLATPPLREHAVAPPDGFEVAVDRAGWDRRMGQALGAIEAGALEKVVLARPITVSGAERDPVTVLARARAAVPSCTSFLCRGRDGAAFIGSTPEKLCRIQGRELSTHALASSASAERSGSLGEDDKDQREHRAVVDGIRASLGPLSDEVQVANAAETVRLSYISHMRTPVRARLREGVSASDAVLALHPTAAVGGTPREPARRFLAEHEGFARGWYAGAVGWFGPKGVDLRVGLRSALMSGGTATVYAGAGIVRGSTAEGEWRETRMKSRLMLGALGAWRDA